jgi:hypothetical protein
MKLIAGHRVYGVGFFAGAGAGEDGFGADGVADEEGLGADGDAAPEAPPFEGYA